MAHVCEVKQPHVRERWETKRLTFDSRITIDMKSKMYEELVEKFKMISLGYIAAGGAHDMRTFLRKVDMYRALALEAIECGDIDEAKRCLSLISSAHKNLTSICDNLLDFGADTVHEFEPVSLQKVVNGTVDLLRPAFSKVIEIENRDQGNEVLVMGDMHQLRQILVNLASNAYQAFGGKAGKITISIHLIRRTLDEYLVPGSVSKRRYVGLSVADTAGGMSHETFAHIADPFFTTKGAKLGVGLGLYITKYLTNLHGGVLTASTKQGEGSIFTVFLPALSP